MCTLTTQRAFAGFAYLPVCVLVWASRWLWTWQCRAYAPRWHTLVWMLARSCASAQVCWWADVHVWVWVWVWVGVRRWTAGPCMLVAPTRMTKRSCVVWRIPWKSRRFLLHETNELRMQACNKETCTHGDLPRAQQWFNKAPALCLCVLCLSALTYTCTHAFQNAHRSPTCCCWMSRPTT